MDTNEDAGVQPAVAPPWDGSFERWARRYVHLNHWRIAAFVGDKDDALQECALVYLHIVQYYWGKKAANGQTIDNPAWLMALFKVAVARRWIDASRHLARQNEFQDQLSDVAHVYREMAQSSMHGVKEIELNAEIASASHELQSVIRLIANAPHEVLELLLPASFSKKSKRKLCRFAGVHRTARADVTRELHALITAPG